MFVGTKKRREHLKRKLKNSDQSYKKTFRRENMFLEAAISVRAQQQIQPNHTTKSQRLFPEL